MMILKNLFIRYFYKNEVYNAASNFVIRRVKNNIFMQKKAKCAIKYFIWGVTTSWNIQ